MSIELASLSPYARWESSRLVDAHNGTDQQVLPWMGSPNDNRGFARLDSIQMESGQTRQALRTHPKWVGNGTTKGWHPWVTLPNKAVFETEVGFVKGAQQTDGVTFMVWEHHRQAGSEVWTRVARLKKYYTGALQTIRADLTHLSGQEVGIELRVDAGPSSGQDWAAWVNPRIVSSDSPAEMPVTLQLKRFTCHNADEDSWYSDGDEPYLYVLAIFADGTTVDATRLASATVRIYSPTKTHGNLGHKNVDAGESFPIPDLTGLFETNMRPVPGLPLSLGKSLAKAGIAVIAMEEDATPTTAINKGRLALTSTAKQELENMIRNLQTPTAARIQQITDSIKSKVVSAIKKETLNSVAGIFSLADPDDYINSDFKMWSYAEIQQAGAAGLPIAMTFKKSGVHYSIEGRVCSG